MHAASVDACWRLARDLANAYQRRLNAPTLSHHQIVSYRAARDAADRIALTIRYGRRRNRVRTRLPLP